MHLTYRSLTSSRRFGVELEVSNNRSKAFLAAVLSRFENTRGTLRSVNKTTGKEGWAQTIQNDYWHVKYDSTCGPLGKGLDGGWEIASFIGFGPQHIKQIAQAAQHLSSR